MARLDPQLERKLRAVRDESTGKTGDEVIIVSVQYTGEVDKLRTAGMTLMADAGGIAIGDIRLDRLEALAALDNVLEISIQPRYRLHLDTSVPEIHGDVVRTSVPGYTGSGVVVGIVDTGIDILHKCFRKADGTTRILSIWDQTLVAAAGENPPAGFTFGVEFTAAQINTAIQASNESFRHQDVNSHGSHVAGIAAGNGSQSGNCHGEFHYRGVAPEADLVIVKGLADPSSANQNTDIGLAVNYIFKVAGAKPAVANLSLGQPLGQHDGTDHNEVLFDGLLNGSTGRAIVLAAGNDGDLGTADDIANGNYSRGTHASGHIAANATGAPLQFVIPPNDKTPDAMGIWYSGAAQLQVTLTEPGGTSIGPIAANAGAGVVTPLAGSTVTIDTAIVAGKRNFIVVRINPPAGGAITSGPWTVTLKETSGNPADYDFWIASSHTDPFPVFVFAQRDRARTINIPATAKNVITVASYGSKSGQVSDFSSRGPTLATDGRQKPDVAAPGEESGPSSGIVAPKSKARGVSLCCDCCVDFYVDDQGTSMSAPHVTGVAALMLQKNPGLTFEQIRATMQTFARNPGGGVALPNNDWGFGKIDAQLATANIPPAANLGGGGGGGGAITNQPEEISSATPLSRFDMSPASAFSFPESKDEQAKIETTIVVDGGYSPNSFFSPTTMPIARRLHSILRGTEQSPAAQLIAALVSTHIDEVYQLIHNNRRVATMWHRMGGPILMRAVLAGSDSRAERHPVIPAQLKGNQLAEPLGRMLTMLARYGSNRLRDDVYTYSSLMLALPGASWSELCQGSFVTGQKGTAPEDAFASWNP